MHFPLKEISLTILLSPIFAQSYNWPCKPFDSQHPVNGTFCECRGNVDHFHDGVDIGLKKGGAVYSVVDEIVTSIGMPNQYGSNAWVRAGRYAYVHINPNSSLSVGDSVKAFETILGWTNSQNHIHFKDGYPGGETNALRMSGGLSPMHDSYNPEIKSVKFYKNNSTKLFSDNKVKGRLDIVCNAAEISDLGDYGGNNGIYKIGYDILNSNREVVHGPVYPFKFDVIPSSDSYMKNVYFTGSNNQTHIYIITNKVEQDNYLDVTHWSAGDYSARIFAYDSYSNVDTTEVSFEVLPSDLKPPEPPTILSVLPESNGFKIQWIQNHESDLKGYRLYFSYDQKQWFKYKDESKLSAVSTHYKGSLLNTTIYFRMTAVDNQDIPNESSPSNVVMFRKNKIGKGFLLIDARDKGMGENPLERITNLSDNFSIGISTINDTLLQLNPHFQIPQFFMPVILAENRKTKWPDGLLNVLNNPTYWILGENILSALNQSQKGNSFLQSEGIDYEQSISMPDTVYGIGNPFENLNPIALREMEIDSINTFVDLHSNDSFIPVLESDSHHIVGMANSSPPRLMTTIPFMGIPDSSQREIIRMVLEFITPYDLEIDESSNQIPTQLGLSFYPNPFNNNGSLIINGEQGTFSVRMFNILGQLIWVERIELSGVKSRTIRIPVPITQSMNSGTYFIQLQNELGQSTTQKIVLLK